MNTFLVEFLLFMFPVIIVPQKFWMTKMSIVEMVLFILCTLSFFIFKQYALVSMAVLFGIGAFLHWTRYLKEKKAKAVAA